MSSTWSRSTPGLPPRWSFSRCADAGRRDFGLAEETLDHRKRAALRRAIGQLLEGGLLPDGRRLPALELRVDLVAIDDGPDGHPSIRHHRGIRP